MSWKVWADHMRVTPRGQKASTKVAICGLDGGAWYKSDDFEIPPSLFKDLSAIIAGKAETAFTLFDRRYMIIKVEDDVIIAKYRTAGMSIAWLDKCFLIGAYEEEDGISPGNNTLAVATARDKLKQQGF